MPFTSLLYLFLFILCSVIFILTTNKEDKWKSLLFINFIFFTLLVKEKIIFLLIYSIWVYYISHKEIKKHFWINILISLFPLFLLKFSLNESHFESYSTNKIGINTFNFINLINIIGISYFTLNSISYLIDIKRKYVEPNKNYFEVLLYLIYFPTVFAGPLHRAKYMFSKFKKINITNESISNGFRLILWGLFKSVVISQRIFGLIQSLNNNVTGVYYLLLGLLFFLYLYCNFSAFVEISQGISEIFNIKLKDNFKNRVYLSNSRQNFWKGWHITLNEWFRDYFFYVIIKYDKKRKYTNLILLFTFILIALWHGFSSILLLWGILNGTWIILEKKANFKLKPKLSFLGTIYHLAISSLLAMVFISKDIQTFFQTITDTPSISVDYKNFTNNFLIVILCLSIMDYHYYKAGIKRIDQYLSEKNIYFRWFIYLKITLLILLFSKTFGINNYYTQF